MMEPGESKLCKVRKHRYYQSFAGKIAASNQKKRKEKQQERTGVRGQDSFRPAEGIERWKQADTTAHGS